MSMQIQIGLFSAEELEAFAVFCNTIAAAQREARVPSAPPGALVGYSDVAQQSAGSGGVVGMATGFIREDQIDNALNAPETAEQKQTRKRRTKAEMEAARAADEAAVLEGRPAAEPVSVSMGAASTTTIATSASPSEDPFPPSELPGDKVKEAFAPTFAAAFKEYQAKNPDHDEFKFMRTKLKLVADKIGMDAAQAFMSGLHFANVSAIKSDVDRDKFIAAVTEELK